MWRTVANVALVAAPELIAARGVSGGAKVVVTEANPVLRSDYIGKNIIRWGTGQNAEAVALTVNRTTQISETTVSAMVQQGLTREWVAGQLTAYEKAFQRGGAALKNTQLQPRTELMKIILEAWPKK
jgi:hypothetical protein